MSEHDAQTLFWILFIFIFGMSFGGWLENRRRR